jgi:hypothetical protein
VDILLGEVDRQRRSTNGVTGQTQEVEANAAAWVIEGLYQAYFAIPQAAFALPSSKRFYSNSRRAPVPFSFGSIRRIVIAAQALGWIRVHLGTRGPEGGKVSTIEVAGQLERFLAQESYEWIRFEPPPKDRLIVMADESERKVRRNVSADESPLIPQWIENLYRINEFFLSSCIHLDASNDVIRAAMQSNRMVAQQFKQSEVMPLNFSQVALRRIFARDKLDHGGRFYGGWWQMIPSRYRKHVSINGCLTREADYSGMALNILYAMTGKDIGSEDPYDIGLAYSDRSDPRRQIVKRYVNASLNDEESTYFLPPDEQRLLGISRTELRDRVARRHAPIACHFHTGIGLHLQFLDSKIAEQVMLRFLELDEVCLPIHDSFIVREKCLDLLVDVMEEEFKRNHGRRIAIKPEDFFVGERTYIPDPALFPVHLPLSEQADAFCANHWSRVSISRDYSVSYVMKTQTLAQIIADYEQSMRWYKLYGKKWLESVLQGTPDLSEAAAKSGQALALR